MQHPIAALLRPSDASSGHAAASALADGLEAGKSCSDKAEGLSPGFREAALAFIPKWLAENGGISSGENITDAAQLAGIRPHTAKAFGSIFQQLLREGVIEHTGQFVRRRKGHGSPQPVWRLRASSPDSYAFQNPK